MSRTKKGALIGAAVGAVAGLLSGDDATERRQRALVGAGVGVGLTIAALAFIRNFNQGIAQLTHLDGPMLGAAVALSVTAAIVAGLLPTWRACQVVPAMQLKSQ